jgi:hypothetical protein
VIASGARIRQSCDSGSSSGAPLNPVGVRRNEELGGVVAFGPLDACARRG